MLLPFAVASFHAGPSSTPAAFSRLLIMSTTEYSTAADDSAYYEEAAVCMSANELSAMAAIGGSTANVYGEITSRGFNSLASVLRLNADDTFVDLGSGLGGVVEQAARDYGVRRAIGVEFSTSRHAKALARLEQQRVSAADGARGDGAAADAIQLLRADCADESLWASGGELASCTCAYTCNLLFDDALNARLKQRVEACPSLRRVAAFRPWPDGLDGFGEPTAVACETSWSTQAPARRVLGFDLAEGGTSLVYAYERHAAFLPAWWSGQIEGMAIGVGLVVAYSAVSAVLSM